MRWKMVDYIRIPLGVWRTENGDQRGAEWEPQISFEIFSRCPKITTTHKHVPKLKYSSQLVTRVSREILRNARKLTQQTEHKTKLERPKYVRNGKSEPPKIKEKQRRNKRGTGQKFQTAHILNSSLDLSDCFLKILNNTPTKQRFELQQRTNQRRHKKKN